MDWSVGLEAAPKLACYLALLVAIGACAAHWLTSAIDGTDDDVGSPHQADRRLASVLLVAAVTLVAGLFARAGGHTFAAFGESEPFWESLRLVVRESDWGRAWRTQMLLSLALVGSAVSVRRVPRAGWTAASAVATASAFAVALLGHAAGEVSRLVNHGVHVLGAGLWLGALAAIRAALSPRGARDRTLSRFAPIALVAASMIAVTGSIASWWYLGRLSSLWTSTYGRTLVLKLAVLVGVAVCGFSNWRRYEAIRAGRHAPAIRSSSALITVELLLAALVVAITAVLTELPHPEP